MAPEIAWKDGHLTTEDDIELHYIEAGAGPSLLFVPGWTMPAAIWLHQIRFFSTKYRVVALDPRGQGDSSKTDRGLYPEVRGRDLYTVIRQLHLAPTVVIAWSMAVMESLAMIDQFGSDALRGLVLVDGHAGIEPTPQLLMNGLQWMNAFLRDRPTESQAFAQFLFRHPVDSAFLQQLVQGSLKTRTDTAVALMVGATAANFWHVLPQIPCHTLVVAAPGPWTEIVRDMARQIPRARFVLMEDAGHALFVDQAAWFNDLLTEFLGTLDRS